MPLHPRNRHQGRYDFELLIRSCPDLKPFVAPNPYGDLSIDFADPRAVKTLNRALLASFYGILKWDIPDGYLCPPIPGRADYLHHLADLLSGCNRSVIPRGHGVRALDIGTGANCIYPIIGHCEYGWSLVGTEADPTALASARRIVKSNSMLASGIEVREQASLGRIFQDVLGAQELFDVSLCNPPFHASLEEAHAGSRRKWQGLGRGPRSRTDDGRAPVLNFGGQGGELWCPGGEARFVGRMIEESAAIPENVFWFSSQVSKEATLPVVYAALKSAGVVEVKTINMAQGQKKTRFVAWTFLNRRQQADWRARRWER